MQPFTKVALCRLQPLAGSGEHLPGEPEDLSLRHGRGGEEHVEADWGTLRLRCR